MQTHVLCYGDNLDILRRCIPGASVDLVCLDPPLILSTRELLEDHRRPDLPLLVLPAYQQAEGVAKKAAEQRELFGGEWAATSDQGEVPGEWAVRTSRTQPESSITGTVRQYSCSRAGVARS